MRVPICRIAYVPKYHGGADPGWPGPGASFIGLEVVRDSTESVGKRLMPDTYSGMQPPRSMRNHTVQRCCVVFLFHTGGIDSSISEAITSFLTLYTALFINFTDGI